ncbi:MAG: hypothetical protein HY735_12185 [Verrucomicrobia bacterium]|nr:hypothetical protein [Verrucomicrobiota bacterium]
MVSTKDSEPAIELAGKNMPASGKNDSPSRIPERAMSVNEPARARTVVSNEQLAEMAASRNGSFELAHGVGEFGETISSARVHDPTHFRLAERVWSAVESFRSAGAHDWVVRIRADEQTELSLRLKLREDQLVIQARLESGNWEAIAPSWPELQSQLANRGVQLRPLETEASQYFASQNTNSMSSENHRQPQQGSDGSRDPEFREFDLRFNGESSEPRKQRSTPPAARPARPARGWESWA